MFYLQRDVPFHARELPAFYKRVLLPLYLSHGEEALRAIFDWCECPQRMRTYAKEAFDADDDDQDALQVAFKSRGVTAAPSEDGPVDWMLPASEGKTLMEVLSLVESRASRKIEDFLMEVVSVSVTDLPPAYASESEPEGEDDRPPARKTEAHLEAKRLNRERALSSNLKDILNSSRIAIDDLEQVLDILIERWEVEEATRRAREDGSSLCGPDEIGLPSDKSPAGRVVEHFNMSLLLDIKLGESVGVGAPSTFQVRR